MTDHAVTLLAQRRHLLRTALQTQIDAGKIPAQIVGYIDALYARHRDFEAERIAGLALWMGTDSGTTWRETCFEGFGIVLRAALTVLHGVACVAADAPCTTPCHAGAVPERLRALSCARDTMVPARPAPAITDCRDSPGAWPSRSAARALARGNDGAR